MALDLSKLRTNDKITDQQIDTQVDKYFMDNVDENNSDGITERRTPTLEIKDTLPITDKEKAEMTKYYNDLTVDAMTGAATNVKNMGVEGQKLLFEEQLKEKRRKQGKGTSLPFLGNSGLTPFGMVGDISEEEKAYKERATTERELREAENLVKASKETRDGELSQFGKSFGRSISNEKLWTFGIADIENNVTLFNLVKKADKEGIESLSEREQDLLEAAALNAAAKMYYAGDLTAWQQAGSGSAESIPFMLQFAATAPVAAGASLLSKAMPKIFQHILKKGVSNKIATSVLKNTARVAAATEKSAVMTALQPGTTGANITDRMLGEVKPEIDENGSITFAGTEGGMSAPEAIGKGYLSSMIENLSEMSGPAFHGLAGRIGNVSKKIPGVGGLLNTIEKNNALSGIEEIMKRVGFNGTIEEFLEEQVNTGLNALLVGDNELSDLIDPKQQLTTLISVAAMGGAFTATGALSAAPQKRKIKQDYDAATNSIRNLFNNEEEFNQFKTSLSNLPIEQRGEFLSQIIDVFEFQDKDITAQDEINLINYAVRQAQYEGYIGSIKDNIKQEQIVAQEEIAKHSNPLTGSVVAVKSNFSDNPVYIVGGVPVFDSEGNIDKNKSSSTLYYIDENGSRKMGTPDMFDSLISQTSLADAYTAAMEGVEETIISREEQQVEAPANGTAVVGTPGQTAATDGNTTYKPEMGDEVTTPNGKGRITQFTPEGKPIVVLEDGTNAVFSLDEVSPINNPVDPVDNNMQQAPIESVPQGETGLIPQGEVFDIDESVQAVSNGDGTFSLNKQYPKSDIEKARKYVEKLNSDFEDNNLQFELVQLPKQTNNPFERPIWGILARQAPTAPIVETTPAAEQIPVEAEIATNLSEIQTENEGITTSEQSNLSESGVNAQEEQPIVETEITPIGKGAFGNIYDQFKGKAKEAIEFLSRTKEGEALGALHHPEIGDIDLVWGKVGTKQSDGYGLSKIAKFHPEVLDNLQEILSEMQVTQRTENRVQLESDKYQAAVRLEWDNQKKTWLLTAFEKKTPISTNSSTDVVNSETGPRNDTATPQNTGVISTDEDTSNNSNDIENEQNIGEEIQNSSTDNNQPEEKDARLSRIEELRQQSLSSIREEKGYPQTEYTDPFDGSAYTLGKPGLSKSELEKYINMLYNTRKQQVESEEEINKQEEEKPAGERPSNVIDLINTVAKQQDIKEAEAEVNTNPSEAQKEAGNYKMGHVSIQGLDITIENPKGSTRSGVDQKGKKWSVRMNNTYGYIRGTEGKDGDHIDVFVGDNPNSSNVFVVDQINPETGEFDEHKVMLGFDTIEQAKEAYLSNYSEGWQGLGDITETTMDDFREWATKEGVRRERFAEHKTSQSGQIVSEPTLFGNTPTQLQLNWDAPTDHVSVMPADTETAKVREKAGYKEASNDKTFVERQLTENGSLTFMGDKLTGPARIKSSADVAFLFKNLESAATENAFAVLIKEDGSYSVLYLGTGGTSQTIVDVKQIVAAADEFGASGVVMVHNHPSGNLIASRPDIEIHKSLSRALSLSGKTAHPSVIINLDSGQYVEFNENMVNTLDKENPGAESFEVPVYQFDRQKLYTPFSEKTRIRDSRDVAEFLSKQKRGAVPKIQAMILDNANAINRYLLIDPNLSVEEISGLLISEIGRHGEYAILASNGSITKDVVHRINANLKGADTKLLDVLEIQQDADIINKHISFANEGFMEPQSEYTSENSKLPGDIRIKDGELSEMEQIKQRSIEDGTFMKAPNGKDTNLNEQQWLQVRTEAFKKWFGDWESSPNNASKVVDENGEPLVVYHGTHPINKFTVFDIDKVNTSSNDRAFFFAKDIDYAKTRGGRIIEAFINIRKPAAGGFITEGTDGTNGSYVSVKNPNQIKSATGNNGEFSPDNNDIRFRDGASGNLDNNKQSAESLSSLEGLEIIETPKHDFKNIAEARTWAKENITGTYHNTNANEDISVSKTAIDKYLSEKAVGKSVNLDAHLSSLKQLPKLIETAVLRETKQDRGDNIDIKEIQRLYGAINYEDENYPVKITVKAYQTGNNKAYSYEVMEIETPEKGAGTLAYSNAVSEEDGGLIDNANLPDVENANNNASVSESQNKDTSISENPTPSEGKIVSEVNELADNLNTPVRIIHNTDEIKDDDPQTEKRKRNSKGWYDTKTGEVVIVLPNAGSAADAQATVLHEVVGHKGLRGLLGDKFDDMMDTVFKNLPQDVRKEIVHTAFGLGNHYNGDVRVATEEYLAGIAENGVDRPGVFNRIISAVKEFFRSMGINLQMTDNDITYLLWKSKNRLQKGDSPMTMIQKAALDGEIRETLYREKETEEDINKKYSDSLDKRIQLGKLRRAFTDRYQPVVVLEETVEKATGKKLKEHERASFNSQVIQPINQGQMREFEDNEMKDIYDATRAIISKDIPAERLTVYTKVKHGSFRNERMRKQKKADNSKDFSGIYPIVERLGYTPDDAGVQQFISEFEKSVDKKLIDNYWGSIKAATNKILDIGFEGGLITPSKHKGLKDKSDYYVPLRGWEEADKSDIPAYQDVLKEAKGRESESADPIPFIKMLADSEIMRANKNKMKQSLKNLVANNKLPGLYSIDKVYEVLQMDPQTGQEAWVEVPGKPSDELLASGKARVTRTEHESDKPLTPYQRKERQVAVYELGEKYVLTFTNPEIAKAINGEQDVPDSNLINLISGINRFMSAANTKWNPEFILWSNAVRDVGQANMLHLMNNGAAYTLQFDKNLPTAVGAYHRLLSGKQDMNNPIDRYMNEFIKNGGETGYAVLKDFEDTAREIKRELEGKKSLLQKMESSALGKAMENVGRVTEGATRLATYITSRENGRSIMKSVLDAKNITGNFNKKGSGETVSIEDLDLPGLSKIPFLKRISISAKFYQTGWMFFNASIQGVDTVWQTAKKHKKAMVMTASAYYAAGAAISFLARTFMGYDDDKKMSYYDQIPEHVRRSNLIIPLGWHRYATLPLPHVFRAFYGMGEMTASKLMGSMQGENIGVEIAGSLMNDVSPIDVASIRPGEFSEGGSYAPLVPSGIRPTYEAGVENKDWLGRPIAKKTPYNKYEPEHRRVYPRTGEIWVKFSELLNAASGGDNTKRGAVNINPAKMEHVFENTLGGLFKFGNKTYKALDAAYDLIATGKTDFELRDAPIIGKMVGVASPEVGMADYRRRYYLYMNKLEEQEFIHKDYRKNNEFEKAINNIPEEGLQYLKEINQYLKDLRSAGDESPEMQEMVQTVIDQFMIDAVLYYEKSKQQKTKEYAEH
ncbi:MAG: hypothetical protein LBK45_01465 [Tannerellaceae bacterium]|jgi:DNA repair protein RadC|nr:hypothetical protein [Tannerellaceae bacterium]